MSNKTYSKVLTREEFREEIGSIIDEINRTKTEKFTISVNKGIPYKTTVEELREFAIKIPENITDFSVKFYFGNSNRCIQKEYSIKKENLIEPTKQSLGTLEQTNVIQSLGALIENNNQIQDFRFRISNLERDLKEEKEKREKAEKEIKELEKELDDLDKDLEEKKQALQSARNTNIMQLGQIAVPLLAGIGIIKPEIAQQLGALPPAEPSITEEQQAKLDFIEKLENKTNDYLDELNELLDIFMKMPQIIPQILNTLKHPQPRKEV